MKARIVFLALAMVFLTTSSRAYNLEPPIPPEGFQVKIPGSEIDKKIVPLIGVRKNTWRNPRSLAYGGKENERQCIVAVTELKKLGENKFSASVFYCIGDCPGSSHPGGWGGPYEACIGTEEGGRIFIKFTVVRTIPGKWHANEKIDREPTDSTFTFYLEGSNLVGSQGSWEIVLTPTSPVFQKKEMVRR